MKYQSITISTCVLVLLTALGVSAQNYKIRQATSMAGTRYESTVYVKGSRQRTEGGALAPMAGDLATIEQCDLSRRVQISASKRRYHVENFATSEPPSPTQAKPPVPSDPVKKGGTVTQNYSIIDTGERKQMFGLTARRIKTLMTMKSSPDACSKTDMKMETDGWYVDLPAFSCPARMDRGDYRSYGQKPSGCQDRYITNQTGSGKLGFPLEQTTTMTTGDSGQSFTTTIETLEFSKATLDDALFEVPAGFSLVQSSQELYGMPDYAAMALAQSSVEPSSQPSIGGAVSAADARPKAKKAGMTRIGVYVPSNRGEPVATDDLQAFLAQKLTVGNVEGVAVSSEAEARSLECDYILSSEISKLKQTTASKVGGLFGKVTSIPSGSAKYEAQVDFTLVSLKTGQPTLRNKAAANSETGAVRAAESVLALEATAILAVAK